MTVWSGSVSKEGLFYYVSGSGVPVVFLHGNFNPSLYLPFIPTEESTVHVPVQSGCSFWRDRIEFNTLSLSGSIEELAVFIRSLFKTPVRVVGHSWGSQLALCFALEHPGLVSNLLLIAPGPLDQTRKEEYRQRLIERIPESMLPEWHRCNPLIKSFFSDGTLPAIEIEEKYAEIASYIFCATEKGRKLFLEHFLLAGGLRSFAAGANEQEVFDACETVTDLRVLTTVLYGTEDYEPVAQGEILARSNPLIKSQTITGSGHYPFIDAPEEFNSYYRNWLQGL